MAANSVTMSGVSKRFGSTLALDAFTLEVAAGEFMCLLGPSGCGKTTALRVIAGFEVPDAGRVLLGTEDITATPVPKRSFGMVFQDYSLFPNLTAAQNIEFGLRTRGWSTARRRARVAELLSVTRLADQAGKYPEQMSGGQKQRVALARAIAPEPRVLLLDEPLSALDAKVREALREEIRSVQRATGITTILVTHDQGEALAIADRVAVMQAGRLEQVATPRELYDSPATPFVAGFVGSVNRLTVTAQGHGTWLVLDRLVAAAASAPPGALGEALIRPEQVDVRAAEEGQWTVTEVTFAGPLTRVSLARADGQRVDADLVSAAAAAITVGQRAALTLRAEVSELIVSPQP